MLDGVLNREKRTPAVRCPEPSRCAPVKPDFLGSHVSTS
jgi:hypothetical protein